MRQRTVGEVMTSKVVRGYRTTSLERVAELLTAHRISGLPVVNRDDKVLGVISHSDLTGHHLAAVPGGEPAALAVPCRAGGLRGGTCDPGPRGGSSGARPGVRRTDARAGGGTRRRLSAGGLMSSPAVTVHPEQEVARAARIMERHCISRLPVVDEEDRLIGIVTRRDLLRVFLRTDDDIRDDVARRISGEAGQADGTALGVVVNDGLVTLRGQARSGSDIGAAIWSAWRVEGVIGVVNQLTAPAAERARDELRG